MINEKCSWDNSDNNAFYEALKAEGMRQFAEKGGLASGCDLRELTPYWSKAQSILEVGAGYGRVIDYLLKHEFSGTITAVERCSTLFQHLEKKYQYYKNVQLLHADARYLANVNKRFDVIFMLWSGIADFSIEEQPIIIQNLAKLLKKNGKFIIDTISMKLMPLAVKKLGEQFYLLEYNGFQKYIREPNTREIESYARHAGFSNCKRIICQTDTERQRWLYISN